MHGALAQLGARNIRIVEAVGSNPICSITAQSSGPIVLPEEFGIYVVCSTTVRERTIGKCQILGI